MKEKAKLLGLNGNEEHIEKKPKAKELQSSATSHKILIPKPKEDQKKCPEERKTTFSKPKRRDDIVKGEAKKGDNRRNEKGNERTVDITETIPFQDIVRKYDISFEEFFKDPNIKSSVSYLRKIVLDILGEKDDLNLNEEQLLGLKEFAKPMREATKSFNCEVCLKGPFSELQLDRHLKSKHEFFEKGMGCEKGKGGESHS